MKMMTMTTHSPGVSFTKEDRELSHFVQFAEAEGDTFDPATARNGSVLNREPDIICDYRNGGSGGIEMVSITQPDVRKWIDDLSGEMARSGIGGVSFARTDPWPNFAAVRRKFDDCHKYDDSRPLELLCYGDELLLTPFDVLEDDFLNIIDQSAPTSKFDRVWLWTNLVPRDPRSHRLIWSR